MVFGADLVQKGRERNRHSPADILPIFTGGAKLGRLWALPAVGLCYSNGGDAGVDEREDQVAGRDLAHGLIKRVPGEVGTALGRPEVAAGNLMAECLVLIDPPKAHVVDPTKSL